MKSVLLLAVAILSASLMPGGAGKAQGDACPVALPPRARQPGTPHATVASDRPLDLRAAPSADAERLGQIEAGETVVAFADTACADGYLWREVVDDGVQGWTTEADAARYFLAPYIAPEPVGVARADGDAVAVSSDLLTFSFDAGLAGTVRMTQEPGYSYREAMSPQPEYRFYEIGDSEDGTFRRAGHISVWVGRDWNTIIGGYPEGLVWKLRYLLDNRPPLPEVDETGRELPVPVLPIRPAAQLIRAQPRYLHFQDGPGLRFVTHYTQMTGQVYGGFEYIYLGITEEGEYVLAGHVPVTVPESALPPFDDARFIAEYVDPSQPGEFYNDYLARLSANINALAPDQFEPSLETLDALFASIDILGGDCCL